MLARLGFLRLALFALTLINMLLPLIDTSPMPTADADGRSLMYILATFVAPVMAPILSVVILFDYVMSRVRAADVEDESSARYRAVARIELIVLVLTLVYWVPFFLREIL